MSTKDWISFRVTEVRQRCCRADGSRFHLIQNLKRNLEFMDFRGSMVTRLKLKGIDGRAHQEWSLRLNLTQHGKTYQDRTVLGMTD